MQDELLELAVLQGRKPLNQQAGLRVGQLPESGQVPESDSGR